MQGKLLILILCFICLVSARPTGELSVRISGQKQTPTGEFNKEEWNEQVQINHGETEEFIRVPRFNILISG